MTGRAAQPIAITIGDPNGIGPEIAVKSCIASTGTRILLIGDRGVIASYADGRTVRTVDPASLPSAEPGVIDIVDVDALPSSGFAPGRPDAASGRAMVAYTACAVNLARESRITAVVGGPHHEGAVHAAGIAFSGYPSLIARLSNRHPDRVFLMLVGGGLRIVHATLHERLADALARLDTPLIVAAGHAARDALQRIGIARPRIGLFGINPHAGEDGLFGDDDARITVPAAAALCATGMEVVGPIGADLMLVRRDCDAFIAAYHDQGHIPVKLLAGREATALTIGADLVFASVGHGSAPDIAGRGIADPSAMLRAVALLTADQGTSKPAPATSASTGAVA